MEQDLQTFHQRIDADNNQIALCNDLIQKAQADINSIINDTQAQDITASVPDIATQVQAIQAQSAITDSPAQKLDVQGTVKQTLGN